MLAREAVSVRGVPSPTADSYMTVHEVAGLLKVNQQTVRNWIDAGSLPAVQVGQRRVRIRRSDLDKFIGAGTKTTGTDAEAFWTRSLLRGRATLSCGSVSVERPLGWPKPSRAPMSWPRRSASSEMRRRRSANRSLRTRWSELR
jgi:excisionase family DNA binding protein